MAELQSRFFQVTEFVTHSPVFKWIFTECDLILRAFPFKVYKSEEFILLETNQKCFATLKFKNDSSNLEIHIAANEQPIRLLITVCLIGNHNKKYASKGTTGSINKKDYMTQFSLPALNELFSENIIVNNSLTVLCEMYDEKVSQFQTNLPLAANDLFSFNQKLKQNFKTLYESKTLCDVIFKIGDAHFEAHTLILKAISPYFLAMFGNNGMKEQNERVVDLTDDTDVTEEVFKNFLDYVYGVKSVDELEDSVTQLLILADKFHIMQLRNTCESFLCNSINENNVLFNLKLSIKYDFKTLKKASVFFAKHCKKIKKDSKEFQELFKEHCDLFEEFLDDFIVCLDKSLSSKSKATMFCQTTDHKIQHSSFIWTLRNCDLIFNQISRKCYKSQEFTLKSKQKFNLSIEFDCLQKGKFITDINSKLKFHLNTANRSIDTVVNISIIDMNDKKWLTKVDVIQANDTDTGDQELVFVMPPIDKHNAEYKGLYFRNFMENNSINILCEVEEVRTIIEVEKNVDLKEDSELHAKKITEIFRSLYENKKLCDVTFIFGSEMFYAHSLVLASVNPYFLEIFAKNGVKDEFQIVVNFSDDSDVVTEEVFRGFLDYTYGLKCIAELENITVGLLLLAQKYAAKDLKDSCEKFCSTTVNTENFISRLQFARKNNLKLLNDACVLFIKINFDQVKHSEDFKKLLSDKNLFEFLELSEEVRKDA